MKYITNVQQPAVTGEELGHLHLFRSVDIESIRPLLATCQTRTVVTGEILIAARKPNNYLYLLLAGRLSVHLEKVENEPIVIFDAGESVGEISLVDGGPASAFVIAQTPSRVLSLDIDTLWRLVEASHTVAKNLLFILSKRMRRNDQLIYADRERLRKRVKELKRERKALRESEARLRQAQKMEAIGTLAGGIAHDFNNLLAAILGYGEMARDVLPNEDQRLRRYLQQILIAGERAKSVVNQILTFSRRGESERKAVDMHSVVAEASQLLQASLPKTIEIMQRLTSEDAWIFADPNQIHQVIVNLATNAAQAMPQGGVLEISLDVLQVDAAVPVTQTNLATGCYVQLRVSDTGYGMDKVTLERIFEPFFTTKGAGEGTGLGLSVAHGIITDHGGVIEVHSKPGRGTQFTVLLSRVARGEREVTTPRNAVPRGNGQTILLVDDNPSLVELSEEMLAVLGYEPIGYTSSPQALEAFCACPERYDLVITDHTMPKMTGLDLAAKLTQIRPGIPIILTTGYSHMHKTGELRQFGVGAILKKPLLTQELAEAIAKALGG